mgnify:CR=1 FL=1|jgi:hypothetical protein
MNEIESVIFLLKNSKFIKTVYPECNIYRCGKVEIYKTPKNIHVYINNVLQPTSWIQRFRLKRAIKKII